MNSQSSLKELKNNTENGQGPNGNQSKERATSARDNGESSPKHYIIVETKKKKEVIQISSSQSEGLAKAAQTPTTGKQSSALEKSEKSKKIKKTAFKCLLCRGPGKKSEMKQCATCKNNFHTTCIDGDYELSKKYVCDRCRFEREQEMWQEQRRLQLQQRQLAQELEKMVPKKSEKEKKKEEYSKRHGQFSARYPYYLQGDEKFKFPIQDKLLIIYREIFDQANQIAKPKPKSHPLIPAHMLADFLQIENFFSTFREELQRMFGDSPQDVRKNFLYISMVKIYQFQDSPVIDEVYSGMLFCLLKIYLSDIFEKNKTDNVKMLNENCFFTLMTNMNQSQDLNQEVIVQSAQQIIRYLATIPSMKKSFEDFIFPETYNLANKIYVLVSLIKGLSEIDTFHEFVASKSQKMQNLTKEKGELVNQLKADEAENLSNKQKIKEYANADVQLDEQLNKNEENGLNVSTRQITREKDKNKKKLQKLATQKDKSQRNIQEIRAKISQISKALPFVTSQVVFLGKDRNESNYFFFCNEPNRIYCRYRSFLLDDNEHFYIYEGKQAISELHKSLNPRGLHERHLADMISAFVKEEIIVEKTEGDNESDITNIQPYTEGIYEPISRENIVQMIKELEETFSNYLAMKSLQWTAPSDRETFIVKLDTEQNLQQIKQMIISLQESFLFVEPISVEESGRKVTVLDSDQDEKSEKKESRKKSPVRLWGINSQRIKKYWVEYLEQCIDYQGVWICSKILKNYVDRYVKKKMEFLLEQQKKQEKAEKQKERHRLRKERHEKYDRYQRYDTEKRSRERSRDEVNRQKPRRGRPPRVLVESSSEMAQSNRPNLRERKKRKFQIDSDVEQEEQEYQQEEDYEEEESQSEDKCEICGEYGEMICCDTCPKVFHLQCLKMKDVPEGDWHCVECMERMLNQRQTRSRAGKAQRQSYI